MLTTGLSMTIRGGGDPRQAWLARRLREWACRLGALPLMRMTASWFGFTSNPPNTSVWRDVPRQWRAPLGSSFATAGHRARRGQGRMIALRPDPGIARASCSPPSRPLRARLRRWPSASLDRGCARRPRNAQVGTEKRFSIEQRNWVDCRTWPTAAAPWKT